MTREELAEASAVLREAADGVDDAETRDRLEDHADQLARLAERDQDPDHGRLDRHQRSLESLREGVDDETAAAIDETNELVTEYRRTLEGV